MATTMLHSPFLQFFFVPTVILRLLVTCVPCAAAHVLVGLIVGIQYTVCLPPQRVGEIPQQSLCQRLWHSAETLHTTTPRSMETPRCPTQMQTLVDLDVHASVSPHSFDQCTHTHKPKVVQGPGKADSSAL